VPKLSKTIGAAKIQKKPTITFEYIKSQFFRVVHADGAIGSITPNGNLHIAFYSERQAIPQLMVHSRTDAGTLGPPIHEQTVRRKGIIREMDVDVVLGPVALDALMKWLVERKAEMVAQAERVAKLQSKNLKKQKKSHARLH